MRNLRPDDWKGLFRRAFLWLDAWIDSSLFRSGRGLREGYERFSGFMDRFHVAGWRRGLNELVSEGATLGMAGMLLMLALAQPAFRETSDDDWLKKSELAVTFLDRYGNEVRGGDGAVCAPIWERERRAMVEELGGDVARRGERKRER